jgi:hypothetical protein
VLLRLCHHVARFTPAARSDIRPSNVLSTPGSALAAGWLPGPPPGAPDPLAFDLLAREAAALGCARLGPDHLAPLPGDHSDVS